MTFNLDQLVITVDKDVSRTVRRSKGTRGINLETDERVLKLKSMEIGDSFFLEGVERKDTRAVVNLGKKVGVFLDPRYFQVDEIAQVAGTRVWRVNESDLPRRGKGAAAPVDKLRYWHHAESGCVLVTGPGHDPHFNDDNPGDGLVEEIDIDTYNKLKLQYEEDF